MLKKTLLYTLLLLACSIRAQEGWWTWMHGLPLGGGVYGTQGLPSPLNDPDRVYEPCQWTDSNGNFWLFGGNGINPPNSVLWKFSPLLNMWVWMNGSTSYGVAGIYGVKGIPSINNYPGGRGVGASSWTDQAGNLWLFGGQGYDAFGNLGMLSDLWKFDPASNCWTWMDGPDFVNDPGNYGQKGIPSALNQPPSRCETCANWTDYQGNLWLFGGITASMGTGPLNDLWKFDPLINEWSWIRGLPAIGDPGHCGIRGVPDPGNDPAARMAYAHWMDNNGNLWLFGGASAYTLNDLWKYDIPGNTWTWIRGSVTGTPAIPPEALCNQNPGIDPPPGGENRSCWNDNCGNFYMFGGAGNQPYNALWHYNPLANVWTLLSGHYQTIDPGSFGIMNVAAAGNMPPARDGAVSFSDFNGNLWLFGGMSLSGSSCDLWRFDPDTSCFHPISCSSSGIFLQKSGSCVPVQVQFDNKGHGPQTYTWNFGDGASSFESEPLHTYSIPGIYTVSLTTSTSSSTQVFLEVIAINACELSFPNIFTPDGDGLNDVWLPLINDPTTIDTYHCTLFNRWGVKLFESEQILQGWDGSTPTGQRSEPGTYYYQVSVKYKNGTAIGHETEYKGFVSLIR
ncbi:MAG: kelch repeat-containing protein [Bacteroidia bacterium]